MNLPNKCYILSRGCTYDKGCNFPFGKLLVILRRSRFGASTSRFCLLERLRLLSTRKSSATAYRVAICGGFAAFSEMTHGGGAVRTYEKNAVCDGYTSSYSLRLFLPLKGKALKSYALATDAHQLVGTGVLDGPC